MNIQDQPLFASTTPLALGAGYHNVGSEGVLRASNESMVEYVQHYYGERCGHLPLNATNIRAIVSEASPEIQAQMAYLSTLFGKQIIPVTFDELKREMERMPGQVPLIVPYINVPELEAHLRNDFGTLAWGLPAKMTHALKNKANFYTLAQEFALEGFYPPDFIVATIFEVATQSEKFLQRVEEIYQQAGVAADYPLGVMLRASEEDGNYGCCMVYENAGSIVVVQDGDAERAQYYTNWQEALAISQQHLLATMNVEKEQRVVISRYIDFADSPGMSVVIMDNQIESLGWNGQLQKPGSKACIGTSTYVPRNAYIRRMQQEYEAKTAAFFEALLRKTAQKCGIDFASIRGVANLDIMIPGELEQRLQRQRKQPEGNYLAECNPRWTNYTDAILTVIGANRKEQTIATMKATILAGIATIDKQPLPKNANPQDVRACIAEKDEILKQDGTRIICRMAKNPMGLIFAGDIARGQQEVNDILSMLATETVL
ncbi:MAG TPA: hypothetical protein VFA09_07995 [Ktedonobacteraceae bacterium]|nr:hypothetical protein [Ktedonobacteraceae bacterium]